MIYLTLGGVTFQDFEIPAKITFGGRQRVAIHELIGGGRVVDVLGPQAAEIRFSGIFSGGDASARAQNLDIACAAGAILPLGWEAFFYNVVISEFVANYEKSYWIPFEICCAVISDLSAFASAIVLSGSGLINSDLSTAAQWAVPAGLGGENFSSASAAVAQVATVEIVALSGREVLNNSAVINASPVPYDAISALNAVTQGAAQLAVASYMGGYLARAVQNISLEV